MMSVGLTVHTIGRHDRLLDVDVFVAILHREHLPAMGVMALRPRPP